MNAPLYPAGGTYADLLIWHMDYWGTRPTGSTTVNGHRWSKNEFKQEFWGDQSSEPNARMLLGNWCGNGSAPGPEHGATVSRILFGDNPIFTGWASDLEAARKRSQGKDGNPKTVEFPEPPPVQPPVASIPRLTEHFMGRDDEVAALATLLASRETPSAVLVQGGPGMGKTELTKAIAHHNTIAVRFGHRRYFVPLETATSAAAMQEAMNQAVGLGSRHSTDALVHFLASSPALVVLDNLETPWEIVSARPAVEEMLASLVRAGVFLVASIRGEERPKTSHWTCIHRVEALLQDDAVELFKQISGDWVVDAPGFMPFIDALGGHPLATVLVAHRAQGRRSILPLWREWQEIGVRLASDPDYEPNRLTSLSLSIELSLNSKRITPNAKQLFAVLGKFLDGLSHECVRMAFGDNALEATERLLKSGLAFERDNRLDMNPAIRRYAEEWRDGDLDGVIATVNYFTHYSEQLFRLGREAAMPALWKDANNLSFSAVFPLLFRADNDSLRNFLLSKQCFLMSQIETMLFDDIADIYQEDLETDNFIMLYNQLGKQAAARGNWVQANAALSHALQEMFRVGPSLWPQEALNRHLQENSECLAAVCMALSDFRNAASLFSAMAVIHRQRDEPENEIAALIDLATARLHEGDVDDAHEECSEALNFATKLDDAYLTAKALRSLGVIELSRDNKEAARDALETSVKLLESSFGPSADLALSMRYLARLEANAGNVEVEYDLSSRATVMLRDSLVPVGDGGWLRWWEIDDAFGNLPHSI